MQEREVRNVLALSMTPSLGNKRALKLIQELGNPEEIFKQSKSKLKSIEGIGEASSMSILTFKDWERVDEILKITNKTGARLVSILDDDYPALLKQIYDPPLLLWVKGNVEALNTPGIAVIGTRNPSAYGKKQAEVFTKELGERNLCIFSGLAYGIDTIAHKSALEVNAKTVAVLGSGIDNLYPKSNADIANKIVKSGGAVITEYPPGTNPDAGNFPVRNRIVSGLSLGVLVIESGVQGGSMITAELGLDQNREIFAIPHTLNNLSGTGCNYLIKKGVAKLVQTVDDILVELPLVLDSKSDSTKTSTSSLIPKKKTWKELELDELSKKVCELLEHDSVQIDDLAEKLNVQTSLLLVTLLNLEMEDIISQKAGKIFELK